MRYIIHETESMSAFSCEISLPETMRGLYMAKPRIRNQYRTAWSLGRAITCAIHQGIAARGSVAVTATDSLPLAGHEGLGVKEFWAILFWAFVTWLLQSQQKKKQNKEFNKRAFVRSRGTWNLKHMIKTFLSWGNNYIHKDLCPANTGII